MNWLHQNITFRWLIAILMISLVLPCSAKQDLKKVLNISTYENVNKPNKTTTCQTVTEKLSQETSVVQQKISKHVFFQDVYLSLTKKLVNLPFAGQTLSSTVPIYILHQQYRL
ncbi:MAG: hypothetical protein WCY06_00845 [Flavobacteriaceae bacterium]